MTDNYQRRQSDQVRDTIDSLIVNATNNETKEILNLFRNMDDKLKDISETLHRQNANNAANELKISHMLAKLEERISIHEKEYAILNVKRSVWKSVLSGVSGVTLLFCAWSANEYFVLRDSKLKTESQLASFEKTIDKTKGDLDDLKEVVNTLRIDNVQKQVVDIKKTFEA